MKACDLIVHCSTQPEPFGRVIVEGQLANRPVIAAAGGGALEIIEDGVNGLLTPPGNATALAAAMHRLLSDSELAVSLANAGARTVRTRFTLETYVAAVNVILEKAVS
jgi:glycosyltransferase involved in cell wall biosynthesis